MCREGSARRNGKDWGGGMSWRSEARRALREYPRIKQRQNIVSDMRITPSYEGTAVQHSASRTTEEAALRSTLTDRELNVIAAVEFAMTMQSRYYNAAARRRMMELVYFKRTHTLSGAAIAVEYSFDAVQRWNTEILAAVYTALRIDKSFSNSYEKNAESSC